MPELLLPIPKGRDEAPRLRGNRQITIVGANGAGKTRFMRYLQATCSGRAYCLSAMQATFPERAVSEMPGSIDMIYEEVTKGLTYLRPDAVSELDKLCYLLFADEFSSLMEEKSESRYGGKPIRHKTTKLDRLIDLWETIFPGNQVMRHGGQWLFKTDSGDDLISVSRLSQGEKAVLYYIAATLYAMPNAVIFIDSPSLFMHPSILNTLWNSIEQLRPDCTFVYNTIDVDFVNSRTANVCIWVKSYDVEENTWDYELLSTRNLTEEFFVDLIGSRRPILFIEGDAVHSIDYKLYTLIFPEYTVRPLGGCDKVIESTRTFNDLKYMHHLDSHGIVDRDRRTEKEVEYLRNKNILVPEVAEVENLFLMEEVVMIMARIRNKDPHKVMKKLKQFVFRQFDKMYQNQALQHVRHRMKREVETKIDARFTCITALETHLKTLVNKLRPREQYNELIRHFSAMLEEEDYAGVLRVFNHKPMLGDSGLPEMLGFGGKDDYIRGVLGAIKGNNELSRELREALRRCFR